MAGSSVDIRKRNFLGVATIPQSPNQVTSSGTVNFAAGQSLTFIVSSVPNNKELSLWNFFFSVVIDDLTIGTYADGEVNFTHLFPNGPALSAGQVNMSINQWLDWADSSDTLNIRVHKIRLTNNDSSPHTYYLFYKAYTLSTAAGV